jgi:hypothetical protein
LWRSLNAPQLYIFFAAALVITPEAPIPGITRGIGDIVVSGNMNNDRAFIGVEDRRSQTRNADMTIQGFSAGQIRRICLQGQENKSE